ncbi:MAG: hypothetical protein LBJ73_03350 [Rickettsiales bacterium]|nr:hypothetical protein [Rickettsiales bacterium]
MIRRLPNKNPGFLWLSALLFAAVAVCIGALSRSAHADIAGTSYIKQRVQNNYGISLAQPAGTIASAKYLFTVIDSANLALNGVDTLYRDAASANVISKEFADDNLSKIKDCLPGMYLSADSKVCQNCGAGYYCPGIGRQRCVYGIATCPDDTHSAEVVPQTWAGKFNNYLDLADLQAMGIPDTTLSQWELISCGRAQSSYPATSNDDMANNAPESAGGTIGPGVYLFTESNTGSTADSYSSDIVVFDRTVGYRSVHTYQYGDIPILYHTFVDTSNAVFNGWTLKFDRSWIFSTSAKNANVTDLGTVLPYYNMLCVWRLK